MIVAPTQKLYFNKFIYCIKFDLVCDRNSSVRSNIIVKQIKKYLKDNDIVHRSRLDWHIKPDIISINFSVYLNNTDMYEDLLKKYNKQISWTSKPLTDKHKETLENKVEVLIREKLLFNRFKYKVSLYAGWRREKTKEIMDWINATFDERPEGRQGDFMVLGTWAIKLYLINNEDLTHVRLCMAEHITNVVRIDTYKEHGIN